MSRVVESVVQEIILLDEDGDGIFSGTISVPLNSSSYYTYVNGGSSWDQKNKLLINRVPTPIIGMTVLLIGLTKILLLMLVLNMYDGVCADLTLLG